MDEEINKQPKDIKQQLRDIDLKSSKIRKKLELEVQPLARAVRRLLYDLGTKRGFVRSFIRGGGKRKFRSGDLEITGEGYFIDKILVRYKSDIVFHFATSLCHASIRDSEWDHLIVYKSGEWEDLIVQEYRKMSMGILEEAFDISDNE